MTVDLASARRSGPPLGLLFAVTAVGMTANALVAPVVPEILAGVGASTRAAGLLVAAPALPAIPFAPFLGILADRYGRRLVLIVCAVVFGATGGASAFAGDLWTLVALRGAQGLASVGLVNLVVVIIADHRDGPERARLIGLNSAVQTLTMVAFPAVGGALTDLGGWQAPFLLYPAAIVVAVAVAVRLSPGGRQHVSWRQQARQTLPVLRAPSSVALLAQSTVVFVLIAGALWTILPLHVAERFGTGPTMRGLLLSVPALGSIVVAASLHRLHLSLGRTRLLVIASGGMAVALAVFGIAFSIPVLVGGLLLLGATSGAIVPTLQDVASGAVEEASRGTMVTTMVSAARLGQAAGPLAGAGALGLVGAPATLIVAAVLAAVTMPPLSRLSTRRPGPEAPVEPETIVIEDVAADARPRSA